MNSFGFLGGLFFEIFREFFQRIFLEEFFGGETFWEDFFGRIFWRGFFCEEFFVYIGIDLFVKILG